MEEMQTCILDGSSFVPEGESMASLFLPSTADGKEGDENGHRIQKYEANRRT